MGIEVAKIWTTPARENDFEVKIVKAPGARGVFGGSKCVLCGIFIKFAKTYCNSEVKCLVNMSYFREVSQNSVS